MNSKQVKASSTTVFLLTYALSGCFLFDNGDGQSAYMTMQEKPFVQVVTATGRLVPGRTVQIQSQVMAKITEIPFDEGDTVKKGEILVRFNDGEARNRVEDARARFNLARARARSLSELSVPAAREELKQLEINREQLHRRVQRKERLHSGGALPLDQLEEARTSLAVLDSRMDILRATLGSRQPGGSEAQEVAAGVAQAKAHLEAMELELQKYTIYSPFKALVISRHAEPDEITQSGSLLLFLASDEGQFAEIEIDERVIGLLEKGQKAKIWPEAFPSRQGTGKVSFIAPRVDPSTGTVRVRIALDEDCPFMIQDLTVQVEIEVRTIEDALLLPASMLSGRNPDTVFKLESDGRISSQPVLLESVNVSQYLVVDGLNSGDRVVDPSSGFSPDSPE